MCGSTKIQAIKHSDIVVFRGGATNKRTRDHRDSSWKSIWTRKHSSRMHAACLPVLLKGSCTMGVPRANKFEQVEQCWPPDVTGGGCTVGLYFRERDGLCTVSSHVHGVGLEGWGPYREVPCIMGNGHMASPSCRQTNIIESITFPQLHWRAVKIQKNRKYMRPKGFRVNWMTERHKKGTKINVYGQCSYQDRVFYPLNERSNKYL